MRARATPPSGSCSFRQADPNTVTLREQLRFPLMDLVSYPDPDLVALWLFALLGDAEDLLLEYLDLWPNDYRPAAQA